MDPDLKKAYTEQPQTATSSKFHNESSLPCCPKRDFGYKPYLKASL